MNAVANIERIESGPAHMDRTGAHFGDQEAAYAEREIRTGFDKAVTVGDANALCTWAPYTTDWQAINRLPLEQRTAEKRAAAKRAQTMAECMVESLDYGDGPSMVEAMQLVLNAARCTDDALSAQARRLLERMAESFAARNC
jgi:hypothetical protein